MSQIVEVQWDYDDDDDNEHGDDCNCDFEDCHVTDGDVGYDIEDGHSCKDPKIMIFMMTILMEADNHTLVSDCGSTTGLG